MIRVLSALLLAAISAAVFAQAPANPPVRIRGTVEKVDGQMVTVKASNGQSMTVKLADNFVVMGVAKAGIADVVVVDRHLLRLHAEHGEQNRDAQKPVQSFSHPPSPG